MFKRILKVVGFVLLGFVLLIGGVVGFMVIRGDFKKKVIKPTSINFSIENTDLILDATIADEPTLGNGRVYSFTIKAEPLDVNVTECTLKLSAPLITFVKWENGEWIKNQTNTFHLNTPIYFVINNVVDSFTGDDYEMEDEDYYDGILTITVKDKSGLLQDTLELEIDRNITSISFKNQWRDEDNKITNGLFNYELKESYNDEQILEAIQGEDYPLEIITAPLKASKPFSGEYPEGDSRNFKKVQEIYFVKDGQPRMIVHTEDIVKLQRYDDNGTIIEDNCNFLRYDTENDRYVFNSIESGDFEFLLATYPAYAIQDRVLSQNMSFIERLQSREENDTPTMLTKKVVIMVNGTEADNVEFKGDDGSIRMNLFQDNQWIANNSTTLDMYDLGLTLSKYESGTGINSRYNELKFLTGDDFEDVDKIVWSFKRATINDDSKVEYGENVTVNFIRALDGIMATIQGLADIVDNTVQYDVVLSKKINDTNYVLSLTYVDPENSGYYTTISFELKVDINTLILEENTSGLSTILIKKVDGSGESEPSVYLDLQIGSCFVLGDVIEEKDDMIIHNFKTLKAGVYLALLGEYEEGETRLINNSFITNINYNGPDSVITLKPIDADVKEVKLYAIVVNSNGSYHFTSTYREILINPTDSAIEVLNSEVNVPIIVGESIIYDAEQFKAFGNGGLFTINGGSYNQGLLFAPRYTKLEVSGVPKEWGNGLDVYTFSNGIYTKYEGDYNAGETYYVKNNFKTVDLINYTYEGITYYLVGYIENNSFVNKVVPTNEGPNYYAKLYPAVVKSKYLESESRLQTAEEVVNAVLTNKHGKSDLADGGEIVYDLSLLHNREITKTATMYVITSDVLYNNEKTYYIFDNETSQYIVKEIANEDINNWGNVRQTLFEKVDAVLISEVMDTAPDTNDAGLVYYIKEGNTLTATEYLKDDWDSYYVIVDYYLISSHKLSDDGVNIEIKARPYTKNVNGVYKELGDIQFVITKLDYQTQIVDKFNIDITQFFINNFIMVNSFYAFDEEGSINPEIGFGGTYFEDEQTKVDDWYKIIAGHKNIEVDWDGVKPNETSDSIGAKVVKTSITIEHEKSEEILRNMVSDLVIVAQEYNEIDEFVGEFTEIDIKTINLDYITAGNIYNPKMKYYKVNPNDNTQYVTLEITEEIISKWADNYTTYYMLGISAEFEVYGTISNEHYIRFEWSYTGGNGGYKIYSPKLRILSRQLQGYSIDVSAITDNSEKLYLFVTEIIEDSEKYKYENGNYTILDDAEYFEGEIYYLKEVNATEIAVNYELNVGYQDGNYTYIVYAVDENGNYLYYFKDNAYNQITSSVEVAFKLKSNGGLIMPNPVYAQQPYFTINDTNNANIALHYNSESGVFEVVSATVSNEFTQLVLQSNDANISSIVNIKVVAQGFTHIEAGNTKSSGLEIINQNMFKYGETSIDGLLRATIAEFNIVRNGEDITNRYTVIDNQLVLKVDKNSIIASLVWDVDKWKLTRTNYDDIQVLVKFESVLGYKDCRFVFTSPYEIVKSTSNATNIIYSGTQFIVAQLTNYQNENQTEDIDTLFKFIKYEQKGTISIRHNFMLTSDDAITAGDNGTYIMTVPTVTEPTNYEFVIYFNAGGEEDKDFAIGSFGLTVKPNMLIVSDVDNLIKLDDLNNSTYNFADLQISNYNTSKQYYSYILDEDKNEVFDGLETISSANLNLSYNITTFTDSKFENKHTTNIASVDNNTLKINPISTLGTYYMNVSINSGEINIGEVNFVVESVSQLADDVIKLETTAKTENEYSLNMLKSHFILSQNSEQAHYFVDNWVETTEFKDGETYTYDDETGKYTLLEQAIDGTTMYRNEPTRINVELSDILWIGHINEHLVITYKYKDENNSDVTLTQKLNTLTYNGKDYTLLGSSLNMTGYTFDISNEHFKDADGKTLPTQMYGNNIAYYMAEGISVIYCKQNAYLFSNGNDILAMSIEDSGKTLYQFVDRVLEDNKGTLFTAITTTDTDMLYYDNNYTLAYGKPSEGSSWSINIASTKLKELQSLGLLYDSFGNNLATDANIIDTINYKADLVFDYVTYKYTVVSNETYDMYIYSNRLDVNSYTVINNKEYNLYAEYSDNNPSLFKKNNNVKSVIFEASEDCSIVAQETISFKPKGNSYTTSITVNLTYIDGTKFKYHENILVVNDTVVDIKYPYNAVQSYTTAYTEFNASIGALTNSIENLYNIEDFAEWLGVNKGDVDWQNNTRFGYDLALRSDIISLDTSDDLTNTKRYNVYKYEQIRNSFIPDENVTYYQYDEVTRQFEVVEFDSLDARAGNRYFTRVEDTTTPISKIEVVATSSTYAIDDKIVKSWFAVNGNSIIVKSPADKAEDETLNLTGYVAFKVYAGDTGAYGYYVLKVVADTQFDRVISFGESRNTQTISHVVAENDTVTFRDVFNDTSYKIHSVANNISSDLILENYSNVYLFKVNSSENFKVSMKNIEGATDDYEIQNGQYVPIDTILTYNNNIQTITLAVVVCNGTSMVHVCNYEVVLKPNVKVDIKDDSTIKAVDEARYEYSLIDKDGKLLKYDYKIDDNNTINISNYFDVTKDGATITSLTVEFVTDDNSKACNIPYLTVTRDKIYCGDEGNLIAQIESNNLQLYSNVKDKAECWLKLTYDEKFVVYLRVIFAPFEFNETTSFTIGGSANKDNVLDLTQIFWNYNGAWDFTVVDSSGVDVKDKVTKGDTTLTFPATYNESDTYYVTITLNNIYQTLTSENIRVDVKPNIEYEYNSSKDGSSPDGKRVTPNAKDYTNTLEAIGSQLVVNIGTNNNNTSSNTNDDYTEIKIKSTDDKEYLTIKVKEFSSVNFTLTSESDDNSNTNGSSTAYQYFVGMESVPLKGTGGMLDFVHSASEIDLRLNVTVYGEKAYAKTYVLYLTLPKTYELSSIYRVDGATFETVENTRELMLKANETNHDIDENFFGDDTPIFVKAGDIYSVNTTYYTVDNNVYRETIPTEEEISNWTTYKDNYYEKVVNESRVAIKVDDTYYYNYRNVAGLGLFTPNNPNRLEFSLTNEINTNTSTIANGLLRFASTDNNAITKLRMTNATLASVEYEFRIFSADSDYSNIEYNKNLSLIDSNLDNDDVELDYISIPYSQLVDDKGNALSIDLAYLEYDPTVDGQIAKVVIIDKSNNSETNILDYNFDRDISATDYVSKLVLQGTTNLSKTTVYKIKLLIITVNGVSSVSSEVTLVISDFKVEYGYNNTDTLYEYVYGGTQIGTLNNVDVNNNVRVTAKVGETSIYTEGTSKDKQYTLDYITTVNGHITQWYLGEKHPTTNLANYNSSNGTISLLNVAKNTSVTLVFNVVSKDSLIIGRIFYKLMIRNNLNIGVNPMLKNGVNLYLGSEVYKVDYKEITTQEEYDSLSLSQLYTYNGEYVNATTKPEWKDIGSTKYYVKTTIINLLQSEDDNGNYNNLFVTLEQYSTGNTIDKGKALYNGTANSDLNTGSQLGEGVVKNYLRFSITERDNGVNVDVDNAGKLYITGNPSGSFVLKISAANETGYGISKTININKYDYTQAQYGEAVNINNGNGRASGTTINLFKDIGLQDKESNKGVGDYAFASYRLGYGINTTDKVGITKDLNILGSNAKVSYKVLTFDYGTAVNDIKNSTNWNDVKEITIKKDSTINSANEVYAENGLCTLKLPSVKTTPTTEKQYQIVSIRLTISYNDETENYYYAHYLVYNAEQIKINKFYEDNGKVITFAEPKSDKDTTIVGAWQSGSEITIMDTNNQGLYSALTLLRSEPDGWAENYTNYYTYDSNNAIYTKVTYSNEAPEYKDGIYYKLNDIATNPSKYEFVVIDEKGMERPASNITSSDGKVTSILPKELFKNKAKITIIIRAINGGANVVEDIWTIQAGKTIIPNDSRPLSDFFLLSEIGQDLYQNYDIIGIGTNYTDFVSGEAEPSCTDIRDLVNGYKLHAVLYKGDDGNDVFDVEETHYVLVGHSTVMSFTFNAGADYFINLTIDDTNIENNMASIDLTHFVTIWTYNTDIKEYNGKIGFVKVETEMELSMTKDSDGEDIVNDKMSDVIDNVITISQINTITKNDFVTVTISNGNISREIQLYFNIVINGISMDSDNNSQNGIDGIMPYNEKLENAMVGRTELSNLEINTELKKELLSLIKFNDEPVVNNGAVDNSTLNSYSISVKKVTEEGYYEITYTYTSSTAKYTRTLKISSNALTV